MLSLEQIELPTTRVAELAVAAESVAAAASVTVASAAVATSDAVASAAAAYLVIRSIREVNRRQENTNRYYSSTIRYSNCCSCIVICSIVSPIIGVPILVPRLDIEREVNRSTW